MSKDQDVCERLLEFHEHGYSIGRVYRQTWRPRAVRLVLIAAALLLEAAYPDSDAFIAFIFAAAMLTGAMIEDFAYIMKTKKLWPLQDKVINWDLVRDIACKK